MPSTKAKFTPKELKFIKGVAEGKTKTQAALDAYDTTDEKVASVIAAQNVGKLRIREVIEAEMERQGITVEHAIKPIARALKDESVSIQLQGSDRYFKLMGAHDKEESGGNTFIFNSKESIQSFTSK